MNRFSARDMKNSVKIHVFSKRKAVRELNTMLSELVYFYDENILDKKPKNSDIEYVSGKLKNINTVARMIRDDTNSAWNFVKHY